MIGNFKNKYISINSKNSYLEQLMQLLQITSDGDLISKKEIDNLLQDGYIERTKGFNIINKNGIDLLIGYKFINY